MSKLKLPLIILAVVAAAGAGLYFSGMVGSKDSGPVKKHVLEPVPLAQDYTVNLADPGARSYAVLKVALQLKPMPDAEWAAFTGANAGGHGGAGEAPGPMKVSTYPKFDDAIVSITSTYTAKRLLEPEGKLELKRALLTEFDQIAEMDSDEYKAGAKPDSDHVGPPYHVQDVYFTKYIVKVG